MSAALAFSPLDPLDFGVIDHPDTDNAEAVTRWLAASCAQNVPVVDYRTFSVGGTIDINFPTGRLHVGALRLRQIKPRAPSCRTLMVRGGVRLITDDLIIDRGIDGTAGTLNDASGLWVSDGKGHRIGGLEVFGASKGQALSIVNCADVTVDAPYLHDLSFDEPTATDDRLQGIWLERVNFGRILNPRISGLTGNVPGRPLYWSRGISLGECFQTSILNPTIDRCDEAVDITGPNNRLITVDGGNIDQVGSWGVKLANSALFCTVAGTIASNCGLSGFVASGPSHPSLVGTEGNRFAECTAMNPGGDPRGLPVGFLVLEASDGAPSHITLDGCRAFDMRPAKMMTYGALNRAPGAARLIDFESYGHTVAAQQGF